MEDVLRQWENKEYFCRLSYIQLSLCLLAEGTQKSWRRWFFLTVTMLLSNRFQSTVMAVGINLINCVWFSLKLNINAMWGNKPAYCGDIIGEVKNGCGRCSQLAPLLRTEWWRKSPFSEKGGQRMELARESSYALGKNSAFPDQKMPWLPNTKYSFFPFVSSQSVFSSEKKGKEKEQIIRRKIWKRKLGRETSTRDLTVCGDPFRNI